RLAYFRCSSPARGASVGTPRLSAAAFTSRRRVGAQADVSAGLEHLAVSVAAQNTIVEAAPQVLAVVAFEARAAAPAARRQPEDEPGGDHRDRDPRSHAHPVLWRPLRHGRRSATIARAWIGRRDQSRKAGCGAGADAVAGPGSRPAAAS